MNVFSWTRTSLLYLSTRCLALALVWHAIDWMSTPIPNTSLNDGGCSTKKWPKLPQAWWKANWTPSYFPRQGIHNVSLTSRKHQGNGEYVLIIQTSTKFALNKVCPKDSYPLPKIDKLIHNSIKYQFLSFLDAYSRYN